MKLGSFPTATKYTNVFFIFRANPCQQWLVRICFQFHWVPGSFSAALCAKNWRPCRLFFAYFDGFSDTKWVKRQRSCGCGDVFKDYFFLILKRLGSTFLSDKTFLKLIFDKFCSRTCARANFCHLFWAWDVELMRKATPLFLGVKSRELFSLIWQYIILSKKIKKLIIIYIAARKLAKYLFLLEITFPPPPPGKKILEQKEAYWKLYGY